MWCARKAVYQYPTLELIEVLSRIIDGRPAIEVGSGMGHIGRLLGIPMTDSYMQTRPDVSMYYAMLGQTPICPPPCVECLDAHEAVAKHRPKVVVACWLTHQWEEGMSQGNSMGVSEERIVRDVETYVHVGNDKVHSQKPIWAMPHDKVYGEWIVSRAADPSLNYVATWNNPRV